MNARTPFNASKPVQLDPEEQDFLDTQKAAIDKARARLADSAVDGEEVEAPPVVISEETEKALRQYKIGQLIESDADPKKNFIHPTDYNRVEKIWGKDDFDHDFGKFHDQVTPGLVHVTHKSNQNIHYTLHNGRSVVGMPDNVTQYDIQMAARKMVAFAAAHNSKECTISGHPDLQYWLWREAATAGITITNVNAADLAIFKERMAKEMAHTGAVRNVAAKPFANYGDGMEKLKKPVVDKEPAKEPPAPPVAVAPAGQSDVMFRAQHKAVQKITQGPDHAVKMAAQNAASRIRFERMAAEQKAAAEKAKEDAQKNKRDAYNAKRRAERAEKKRAALAKAASEAREARKAAFQARAAKGRANKPRPVI